MSAAEFLRKLTARDVRLTTENGGLRVQAPRGVLDDADRRRLAEFKVTLLALLVPPHPQPAHRVKAAPLPEPKTDPLALPAGWTAGGWIMALKDRASRTQDVVQSRQLREAIKQTRAEWIDRPADQPDGRDGRFVHRDGLTSVPFGWQPDAWCERLQTMADRCQDTHPHRAGELRTAADRQEENTSA